MSKTKFLMLALAGSALATVPAHAGGLLGGAGDCLCQAVNGLLSGGSPGMPGGGLIGNGSIVGSVTGSVSKSLDVTASRSVNPRGGSASANAGLAGSVTSVANATVGANGLGKTIGLAGMTSTDASANKQAGFGITGVGTDQAKSLAGQVTGTTHAAANKTLAITEGHGGGSSGDSVTGSLNGAVGNTLAISKGHGDGSSNNAINGTLNGTVNQALTVSKTGGSGSGLHNAGLGSLLDCSNSCSGGGGGTGNGSKGGKGSQGANGDSSPPGAQSTTKNRSRERDGYRDDLWEQPNRWQHAKKD